MEDEEPSWQRQLLIGLSVLLVIGVLIGAIVAVIAVKAADYAGVGDRLGSTSSPGPILPSTGSITEHPTTSTPPTTSPPTTSKPPGTKHLISLTAKPLVVFNYQRVTLTGSYPGHDGTTLQVQRSVGTAAWSDFPATTRVNGDRFATYIQTAMTGVNHFRMLDKATGETSNVVHVTIG